MKKVFILKIHYYDDVENENDTQILGVFAHKYKAMDALHEKVIEQIKNIINTCKKYNWDLRTYIKKAHGAFLTKSTFRDMSYSNNYKIVYIDEYEIIK